MKNRLELAQYFAELGFTKGAEIGVEYGKYSKALLDTIPNLKLLSVDSWHKYGCSEGVYQIARDTLSSYSGSTITRSISMRAVRRVPNDSLDFVFIDASHDLKSVREDINEWSKKVRPGGIVAGHDYFHTSYPDVTVAVNEYVKQHGLKLETIGPDLLNTNIEEIQPSWYFFKPL